MSSPASSQKSRDGRPRSHKPAAGADGNEGSQQALRVHSDDGAPRAAARSIVMPRASTELTEMLAGDLSLSVRRWAGAASSHPRTDTEPATESPRTPAVDGELAAVIEAWPGLPRSVRAAILAMIRETAAGEP